jgi:hypothetical protein
MLPVGVMLDVGPFEVTEIADVLEDVLTRIPIVQQEEESDCRGRTIGFQPPE